MKFEIKYRHIVFVVILIVLLVVGVPIIINEVYKCNSGYITLWEAKDVLAYYGAALGGGATLIALIITIMFT